MKVTTDYGEQEIEEVIRCYNLWRKSMINHNKLKSAYNQTEEGKLKNREKVKSYYERNKDRILEKRKDRYQQKKLNSQQRQDELLL